MDTEQLKKDINELIGKFKSNRDFYTKHSESTTENMDKKEVACP